MPIYTVSQVALYVRDVVDSDRLLADLYITGEVSNLSRAATGHCYFTLKDGESQLRCVMWRDAQGVELLQSGEAIVAHGRCRFYQARGDLQFYPDFVQPEGVGELHLEFLRVKAKLEDEGLFDDSRKRPLPPFPKRIAVITSRTGAVLHDIQSVLSRRYPLVELLFLHTPVQGEQAPEGIISALRTVNLQKELDMVILARGGGSLEELWAFNREDVARAVHASRVPVVSAVGHETDYTIIDYVADLRAPTPSAAAELAVPDMRALEQRTQELRRSLSSTLLNSLGLQREEVRYLQARLERLAPDVVSRRQRIDELIRAATAAVGRQASLIREQLHGRELQLISMHPGNTLSRGYALVQRLADGRQVSRVGHVEPGDGIAVQVSDGAFRGQVLGGAPDTPRPKGRPRRRAVAAQQRSLWE